MCELYRKAEGALDLQRIPGCDGRTAKAIKAASPTDLIVGPAASERSWYYDSNQSFLEEIFARGVRGYYIFLFLFWLV